MAVYTNKIYLVADTLEELHEFATSIGLFKPDFIDHRRRPGYAIKDRHKLMEAYQMGALIKSNKFVLDKSREMRRLQRDWYKTATDEEIEAKIRKTGDYIADHKYNYEGMTISGELMTEMAILLHKNLRDGIEFDTQKYIRENIEADKLKHPEAPKPEVNETAQAETGN